MYVRIVNMSFSLVASGNKCVGKLLEKLTLQTRRKMAFGYCYTNLEHRLTYS